MHTYVWYVCLFQLFYGFHTHVFRNPSCLRVNLWSPCCNMKIWFATETLYAVVHTRGGNLDCWYGDGIIGSTVIVWFLWPIVEYLTHTLAAAASLPLYTVITGCVSVYYQPLGMCVCMYPALKWNGLIYYNVMNSLKRERYDFLIFPCINIFHSP